MNAQPLRCAAALCATLSLAAWVHGGEPEKPQPPRLTVSLTDGSRIIGTARQESLALQTAYARLDIPLPKIHAINLETNHESASLALANGDKLTGTIGQQGFELETVFGKVTLDRQVIVSVAVRPSGTRALEAILRDGLVLYYAFDRDGEGKAVDASPSKRDGRMENATWAADGKVGGGCSFNGRNARIVCGRDESLNITRSLTVSLWFRKSEKTWGEPHQLQAIIGKDDGDDRTGRTFMLYRMDKPWNTLAFSYGVATGGTDGRNDLNAENQPLADDQWHHILAVHETDVGNRLYVDGKCVAKDSEGSPLPSTPNTDWIIGKTQAWEPWFFYGTLDEVMIFNRALSEDEARAVYDGQK